MATKAAKRKSKGKRHPAHAASFKRIGESLKARAETGAAITPQELLGAIAEAFLDEARGLRKIVR